MFMEEILRWWWTYHVSRKEIEKIKKNMKKVPVIEKKAEIYHQNQDIEAEIFIDNALNVDNITKQTIPVVKDTYEQNKEMSLLKKLIYKIKDLLFKKSDGN